MSKYAEGPIKTQAECQRMADELLQINGLKDTRFQGICVTEDHWTGKNPMPGVAMD